MERLQQNLTLIGIILILLSGGTIALNDFLPREEPPVEIEPGAPDNQTVTLTLVVRDTESREEISFAEVIVIPKDGFRGIERSDSRGTTSFELKPEDLVEVTIRKEGYEDLTENIQLDHKGEQSKILYLRRETDNGEINSNQELQPKIDFPDLSSEDSPLRKNPDTSPIRFDEESALNLVGRWLDNKSSIFKEPYEFSDDLYEFIVRDGGMAKCFRNAVIPDLKEENKDREFSNHQFLPTSGGSLVDGLHTQTIGDSIATATVIVHIQEVVSVFNRGTRIVERSRPYSNHFRYVFRYDQESSSWKISDYCKLDPNNECENVDPRCPVDNG